jgi:hypothetical protein
MLDAIKNALFVGPGQIFGVRSIIAISLTGAACYLWIVGEPVTDVHITAMVGFDGLYAGGRFAEGKGS